VLKSHDFKNNNEILSTLKLTQVFEKTFPQFAYVNNHFSCFFYASLPVSGF